MTKLNEINFMSKSTSESTTLSDNDLNFVEVEFDDVPTTGSDNLVTSGTVATALSNVSIAVDDALSETSENPVQNKVITAALKNIVKITYAGDD